MSWASLHFLTSLASQMTHLLVCSHHQHFLTRFFFSFPLSYGIHMIIQAGRHLTLSPAQSLPKACSAVRSDSTLLRAFLLSGLENPKHRVSTTSLGSLFHSLTIPSSSSYLAGKFPISVCVCCLSAHHTPLRTGPTFAITFLQHWKAAIRSLKAATSPGWTSRSPSASPHTATAPAHWAFW